MAEGEWTNEIESILLDFRKLMIMKCDLKLCIYQIKKRKAEEGASGRYLRSFEEVLGKYTDDHCGEQYLLLDLDRRNEKAKTLFSWRAGSNGRIRHPRFRSFPGNGRGENKK